MRSPSLLAVLLLVSCVRSPVSRPPPPEYDESIKFSKALDSPGADLDLSHQKLLMDGTIVQAMMIAAKDFIPPAANSSDCFTKPSDFLYEVIREENIIFVEISPNYYSCERGPWPLDWGAKYAISTEGRILRRVPGDEPDETSSPPSPDAGEPGDAGFRQTYELNDQTLDRIEKERAGELPFFMTPEWQAQHPWPPSKKPRLPASPDGGSPDSGPSDGGAPSVPPQ